MIRTAIRTVNIATAALLIVMAFVPVTAPPVAAQENPVAAAAEVNRRLSALEELRIEHRLSVTETTLDNISQVQRGIAIGIGLLVVEAAFRIRRKPNSLGEQK